MEVDISSHQEVPWHTANEGKKPSIIAYALIVKYYMLRGNLVIKGANEWLALINSRSHGNHYQELVVSETMAVIEPHFDNVQSLILNNVSRDLSQSQYDVLIEYLLTAKTSSRHHNQLWQLVNEKKDSLMFTEMAIQAMLLPGGRAIADKLARARRLAWRFQAQTDEKALTALLVTL